MNEQLQQLIDDEIRILRRFIQPRIGDIELRKDGKIFLQPGESRFRNTVIDRITFIYGCFGEHGIPENLQDLIVSQVVQQVLEISPPYLHAKKDLSYTQQRDLEHELTLHFTRDSLLEDQRREPSHKDLKNHVYLDNIEKEQREIQIKQKPNINAKIYFADTETFVNVIPPAE